MLNLNIALPAFVLFLPLSAFAGDASELAPAPSPDWAAPEKAPAAVATPEAERVVEIPITELAKQEKTRWGHKTESAGALKVVYYPGAKEALTEIDAERRKFYEKAGKGPNYFDEQQEKMMASSKGQAAMVLEITPGGQLIGAFKKPKNMSKHQHHQIWAFDLNEKGKTAFVSVKADSLHGKTVVVYATHDKTGKQIDELGVTAFDAFSNKD